MNRPVWKEEQNKAHSGHSRGWYQLVTFLSQENVSPKHRINCSRPIDGLVGESL